MDLDFSTEDEAFRQELRSWLAANLPSVHDGGGSIDDKLGVLHEGPGGWERRLKWHRKLNEGGWVGLSWPKEYGGRGATLLQSMIYEQELERAGSAVPFTGFGISLLGPTLIHW